MKTATNISPQEKSSISTLNIIVIILSVYVLVALLVDTFFHLPPEISKILDYIDSKLYRSEHSKILGTE